MSETSGNYYITDLYIDIITFLVWLRKSCIKTCTTHCQCHILTTTFYFNNKNFNNLSDKP